MHRMFAFAAMNKTKNSRYEKQGGQCRHAQATDDRAAEWRVLLAAFAKTQCHRHHADNHRERRHQHWPQPTESGFKCGGVGIVTRLHPLPREADDEDGIRRRHPPYT